MIDNLTSNERILKTVKGERIDRIPVMPFDTFEILQLRNGSEDLMFATGEHLNEFTNGWKRKDPLYGEVVQYAVESGCDIIHRTSWIKRSEMRSYTESTQYTHRWESSPI
ncbi:MAG: hypothetical protein AMS17_19115 [Spirochaetes bacterium DG_61]|nr:MAG: hypothetical protein AMS17_19115 [Spirochaetes bacterium DG_61]